ncbi:MAG: hypothetical protein ABJE95_18855 [Byssovorax sp.]
MWFGIILQLFMLGCLAVLVWYAGEALRVFSRIDASFDKLRGFLNARDISRQADETEERAEVGPLRELIKSWLPLTYSRLGKLLSTTEDVRGIGAELAAQGRGTVVMPPPAHITEPPPAGGTVAPPAPPPSVAELPSDLEEVARQMDAANNDGNRLSDDGGETQIFKNPAEARRTSGYHAPFFSPASIPVLPSAPAQVAAGLGPRPSSSTVSARGQASRAVHPPPVRLAESTRSATLMGTMPAPAIPPVPSNAAPPDADPGNRTSWEPLKRGGMNGTALRPGAEPRFPGTQVSMQAITPPGSASPSSGRRAAPVEVKEPCRSCDGGFVQVGTGGIGMCRVCSGSGLVETAAQP